MPYRSNQDLPGSIKNTLPEHAQAIYRAVFNHAWSEYKNPSRQRKSKTAHRVAWAAVKDKYEKQGDKWVAKEDERISI